MLFLRIEKMPKQHTIQTDRTQLRYINTNDIESIHELHSIPEVAQYNTLALPKSKEDTHVILAPLLLALQETPIVKYTFAIESLDSNMFMGLFGINVGNSKYCRADIWYKLHPKHWNQGFATEIVKEVLDFCFKTLQLHRIEAGCATANLGSIKVLEKSGFTREGHCRKILPLASGWSDNYQYAILESDPR